VLVALIGSVCVHDLCITLRTQNGNGISLCLDWHLQELEAGHGISRWGSYTLFSLDLALDFFKSRFTWRTKCDMGLG